MHNNQKIITFASSNKNNNIMNKKEEIRNLLVRRMELKSKIEKLRFLQEATGRSFRHTIDQYLDMMKTIDRVIEELEKN